MWSIYPSDDGTVQEAANLRSTLPLATAVGTRMRRAHVLDPVGRHDTTGPDSVQTASPVWPWGLSQLAQDLASLTSWQIAQVRGQPYE